jgi:lipopolysaccharide heptosyltransferase I
MRASPRILIIRLSSLGDILHTLPALADLRTSFPEARIDWLVGEKSRFLLSAVRGIDDILPVDTNALSLFPPHRPAWRSLRNLVRNLRSRRYHYVIDFQGLLKTAFLALASGSRTRLGYSKELVREPPAHWFYHQSLGKPDRPSHVLTLNRMLAGLAGARPGATLPDFIVPDEDFRHIHAILHRERLGDFVVMNPGGGWATKRWKAERFGALAARIRDELGLEAAVTTGPGEEPLYRAIAEHSGGARPRHVAVSFLQLIPLLRKCSLFIGGDTGPFHLACALGTPAVGVFGPTSPVRNGPWQEGDEAVCHTLECSFCYKRTCPTRNECMDISVDEVFDAVLRRLRRKGGAPVVRS